MNKKLMKLVTSIALAIMMIATSTLGVLAEEENPENGNKNGLLSLKCQSAFNGNVFYKTDASSEFSLVNINSRDDGYRWFNDISLTSDSTSIERITLQFRPDNNYQFDTTRGFCLWINGNKKTEITGEALASYKDESSGYYTFTLKLNSYLNGNADPVETVENSSFEVEFGWENANNGPNPPGGGNEGEGGNGGGSPQPEHYGEAGYLSFDVQNAVDGNISYAVGTSAGTIGANAWTQISKTEDNSKYNPLEIPNISEGQQLFLKVKAATDKQLDADGRVLFMQGANRDPLICINGTYNDDPNYSQNNPYDGEQLEGIGLNKLYDPAQDCYIIPFDVNLRSTQENQSIFYMEFKWIDAKTITVEVDDASQYMLSNNKAKIGISTGKGFVTSVQNGSNVSIPILPEKDLEGDEGRYLIELQVNPKYFIPYFTFNGEQFKTFDSHSGTSEYTAVSADVPSVKFNELLKNNNNKLTIHLTVDKNVDINPDELNTASSENAPSISASYNMINNGEATGSGNVEQMDAEVSLKVEEANLTEEGKAQGQIKAYEIDMKVNGSSEREFATPITINIPGEYDTRKDYIVYREHEGEETQTLDCTFDERGLSFATNKFSKFTIVEQENHQHSYQDVITKATLTSNGKIETKCTECGDVANTRIIYRPAAFKLSTSAYTYNGKVRTPSLTVTDANKQTIAASNYTLKMSSGRKKVGQYTYTITFKGNYSGTKSVSFVINPKGTKISKYAKRSRGFKVYWKKQSTQTSGYQIQYSTSSKFKNAKTVTITKTSSTSKVVSKLKAKKTYYVRIRTYKTVSGKKYYSGWSSTKKVKTR